MNRTTGRAAYVSTEGKRGMMAINGPWRYVSGAAVRDIQDILSDESAHYKVRRAAAERLTVQALLYQIVMKPNVYATSLLDRITDQALLIQIARQCEAASFRKRAAERIEDAVVLQELTGTDLSWEVRAVAYRRLGNNAEADTLAAQYAYSECDISYVATNSAYSDTREWALAKIPDNQQVFLKAAKKHHSDAALTRLNPAGLIQIFLSGDCTSYANKAGESLIRLSEEGRTDWIMAVDDAALYALVHACFEKRSEAACILLKLTYKNGKFVEQIHQFKGRMVLPERHSDSHHDFYDLGDHMDMGHTDTIEQPVLFQPD